MIRINNEGHKTCNNDYYDSLTYTLNDKNHRISVVNYFQTTDKPNLISYENYITDNNGFITKINQTDTNLNIIRNTKYKCVYIIPEIINKYDDKGNKIYESFYNFDRKLKECYFGFAAYQYKFDDKQNIIEVRNIGTDGNLKETSLGVAIEK